jgi:hypothetical protein
MLNAVSPGVLVHLVDQLLNRRFLVDTGACFSILPHHSSSPPAGPHLTRPAGSTIPCWGEKQLDLCFHGRRFQWTFLLAAVKFPILGVDFLRHFNLMVGSANGKLVDASTLTAIPTVSSLKTAAAVPQACQTAAPAAGPKSPASTQQPTRTGPLPLAAALSSSVTGLPRLTSAAADVKLPSGLWGAASSVSTPPAAARTSPQEPWCKLFLQEFSDVVNPSQNIT